MNAIRIAIGAWIALVLVQPAWYLWLAPPRSGNGWLAGGLMLPPLLLPLAAWRSGVRRMLLWASVLALFYFCHGVVAAWIDPNARGPALLEAAACVLLIGAFGACARGRRA